MSLAYSVEDATDHLRRADPVLARVMDRFGPFKLEPRSEPYVSLIRSIMFQQLARPAASAILRRLLALYSNDSRVPGPLELLATTDEQFRLAGVSRQKAGYLRDLASHVAEGTLDFDSINHLADQEIIVRLTTVKGIGEWTAHMFLMFDLGRPDVLPIGDLGVRKGMRLTYHLEQTPTPADARVIGDPWAPYRSVGSWYMWRAAEGENDEW